MEETVETTAQAAEPTESAPVETEVEETEETIADDPGAEPSKPKGVQKRIDELVRQREEERRRAERLETMLHEAYTRQQPQQKAPEPPPPTETAPSANDFADYDQYLLAAARFEAKQELRQEMARQRQEEETKRQQSEQLRAQNETATKAAGFMSKGRDKYEDFGQVIESSQAPATPYMQQALIESDMGHEVAYYLAKNPAESERIAGLSPLGQVRELTKLEIKLTTAPAPKSSAPPPINPVGAKSGAGIEPDATKNPDAWLAWERARVKALGKRF